SPLLPDQVLLMLVLLLPVMPRIRLQVAFRFLIRLDIGSSSHFGCSGGNGFLQVIPAEVWGYSFQKSPLFTEKSGVRS
ncbi:MAG: hypothetical protein V1754_09850, partial [Pseudomonadota bacterium]